MAVVRATRMAHINVLLCISPGEVDVMARFPEMVWASHTSMPVFHVESARITYIPISEAFDSVRIGRRLHHCRDSSAKKWDLFVLVGNMVAGLLGWGDTPECLRGEECHVGILEAHRCLGGNPLWDENQKWRSHVHGLTGIVIRGRNNVHRSPFRIPGGHNGRLQLLRCSG
jgi:hypothetical protein